MIVYRDRTFCTAKDCKHYSTCPLVATDKVRAEAEKAGLPLSLVERHRCFEKGDSHEIQDHI